MGKKTSLRPVNRYRVEAGVTHVAYGDQVYRVEEQVVELPAGARWHADLVSVGVLTLLPVEESKTLKVEENL